VKKVPTSTRLPPKKSIRKTVSADVAPRATLKVATGASQKILRFFGSGIKL